MMGDYLVLKSILGISFHKGATKVIKHASIIENMQ
jgi:hypothetical protein